MVNELGTVTGVLFGRGAFPHTGTQIIIFAIAVVVLLVVGILLWYYSHPRRRKDRDSGDGNTGPEE